MSTHQPLWILFMKCEVYVTLHWKLLNLPSGLPDFDDEWLKNQENFLFLKHDHFGEIRSCFRKEAIDGFCTYFQLKLVLSRFDTGLRLRRSRFSFAKSSIYTNWNEKRVSPLAYSNGSLAFLGCSGWRPDYPNSSCGKCETMPKDCVSTQQVAFMRISYLLYWKLWSYFGGRFVLFGNQDSSNGLRWARYVSRDYSIWVIAFYVQKFQRLPCGNRSKWACSTTNPPQVVLWFLQPFETFFLHHATEIPFRWACPKVHHILLHTLNSSHDQAEILLLAKSMDQTNRESPFPSF